MSVKHGHASRVKGEHPLYGTWLSIITRCNNPNYHGWADYGGRGIAICDRWRHDFAAFLADVGERPDGLTLDRIDNDGPYAPGNVRWATPREQVRNRRGVDPVPVDCCFKGHPYDEENLHVLPDGKRRCRKCDAARQRARRAVYGRGPRREVSA